MVADRQGRGAALVTGSGRRVGRAIAATLVADGWSVTVHARELGRAREAAAELGAAGAVAGDLADVEQLAAVAREVVAGAAAGGAGLGLLVNSASTFERTVPWDAAGVAEWANAFQVNARAPYLLTSALLPALEAGGGGAVINVSDHAARDAWPTHPLHAASKAALESLTLSGAAALAPRGVRMLAISPGTILVPDGADPVDVPGGDGAGEQLARFLALVVELASDPTRSGEVVVM